MTNKSFVGVDQIYYATVTTDTSAAYAAATPAIFAPAMNIAQAPKTNSKVQYADNQPYDSMSSEGETELDVEITGLPLDIQAEILGRVYDAVNARMYDNGGTAPYIALGFRAKKSDGTYRYYWFLKGTFAAPPEEQATQTDTPDPKSTKLKFTAIRTIHQFDLDGGTTTDSVKRVVGDTEDVAFDESTWFDNVQVPSAGSPAAFTCTPSPADAATGVAVSVSPTLTFSNPLAGNAENGIIITSAAGAVVALARTINAARTVVTLNPDSNLSSATDYLIVVAGVTDVYGQSLANTVYDFETA